VLESSAVERVTRYRNAALYVLAGALGLFAVGLGLTLRSSSPWQLKLVIMVLASAAVVRLAFQWGEFLLRLEPVPVPAVKSGALQVSSLRGPVTLQTSDIEAAALVEEPFMLGMGRHFTTTPDQPAVLLVLKQQINDVERFMAVGDGVEELTEALRQNGINVAGTTVS